MQQGADLVIKKRRN